MFLVFKKTTTKPKQEHLLDYGVGLERFCTPGFACGEEGKTSAVTFHQRLEIGFFKNLCWHLWFLLSKKLRGNIFR